MAILLLEHSLKVEVFYEESDSEYEDNICICLVEDCPDDEKILRADETNIYLTREQATGLAAALLLAVEESQANSRESGP